MTHITTHRSPLLSPPWSLLSPPPRLTRVVELAVAVRVGVAQDVVDVGVRQRVSEPRHDELDLVGVDEAVVVAVEHGEGVLQLTLLVDRLLPVAAEHAQEVVHLHAAALCPPTTDINKPG